jgi:hypothetical protein
MGGICTTMRSLEYEDNSNKKVDIVERFTISEGK